jgi:ribosomal protein S18 acetylase RimI-like enzyme
VPAYESCSLAEYRAKRKEQLASFDMSISTSISRLAAYYSRNGFEATIGRIALALKRALFARRMVVFYCDLGKQKTVPVKFPSSPRVERLKSYGELSQEDLYEMTSFWNPKQAHRNIRERFAKGASLWLIRSGENLAGYGWTLQGHTIGPHYFPLAQEDVHFFDFHVFPQYRGRGINPFLVTHVLHRITGECGGRAFIEAAEWNEAQLSSLQKTPFRSLGYVRKFTVLHCTIVCWPRTRNARDLKTKDGIPIVARSFEQKNSLGFNESASSRTGIR